MKKVILFALILTLTASCTSEKPSYKVTVIRKTTDFLNGLRNKSGVRNIYDCVTASGDTVQADVPDKILLTKKLPFAATMQKNEIENVGVIVE